MQPAPQAIAVVHLTGTIERAMASHGEGKPRRGRIGLAAGLVFLLGLGVLAILIRVRALVAPAVSGLVPSARAGSDPGPGAPTAFVDVTLAAGFRHVHHKPVLDEKLEPIMSWVASVGAAAAAGGLAN